MDTDPVRGLWMLILLPIRQSDADPTESGSITPKSNFVPACGLPVKLADFTEYFFPVAQSVISPIG